MERNLPTITLLEEIPCDCSLCRAFAAIEERHAFAGVQEEDLTAREIVASGHF